MFSPSLQEQAALLLEEARRGGVAVVTAESCTGGMIAALLTEIPGASDVFMGGCVVYANEAKTATLGVSKALIAAHGAVSEAVARAMAEGAWRWGREWVSEEKALVALAVTGVAGPSGGTPDKPVGLVHLAAAGDRSAETRHVRRHYAGDRHAVRLRAMEDALALLAACLEG